MGCETLLERVGSERSGVGVRVAEVRRCETLLERVGSESPVLGA